MHSRNLSFSKIDTSAMGQHTSAPERIKIGGGGGGGREAEAFVVSRSNTPTLCGAHVAVELPLPSPYEAVVAVHVAALNPSDARRICGASTAAGLLCGNDEMPHGVGRALPLPFVCGADGAGVIESLGDERFAASLGICVGDRVQFHMSPHHATGALATAAVVDLRSCFKIGDDVSFQEAAAMPTCGWTAYIALFDKLRIQPGMTVLINGGSGGVGHVAVQLARHVGCRVYASCSPRNLDFVASLGANTVIDYTRGDLGSMVRDLTGGAGVDCILDTAGTQLGQLVGCTRFGGSICCLQPQSIGPVGQILALQQISLSFVHLDGLFTSDALTAMFQQVAAETLRLLAHGAFRMCVEPLSVRQILDAAAQVATGHTRGKLVINVVEK